MYKLKCIKTFNFDVEAETLCKGRIFIEKEKKRGLLKNMKALIMRKGAPDLSDRRTLFVGC
ncbi:hypothetical protein HQ40_05020 [Porphyromonas gulae]|nr:hypothetical protein HQ40_05020 [Porphyromonas gulae]